MYDAEEPGTIINEFLITLFVPGIIAFVGLWAVFRLYWNDILISWGLPPIVPQSGAGAISGGYGRFVLIIVLTAVLLLPYIALYRRYVRQHLRHREIV